jgi:hypothetical protein
MKSGDKADDGQHLQDGVPANLEESAAQVDSSTFPES